jgi:hypothetical protein
MHALATEERAEPLFAALSRNGSLVRGLLAGAVAPLPGVDFAPAGAASTSSGAPRFGGVDG